MIRKKLLVVLVMTAMCVAASPALADYLDVFLSVADQRWDPSDPTVGEDGVTVTWPDEWEGITLPHDENIPPGGSILLGLENLYVANLEKHVTLRYDGSASILPADLPGRTRAGYPQGGPGVREWNEVSHGYSGVPLPTHVVEGIIRPQPSWEWIKLTNTGAENLGVTIREYTSDCVPEPATLSFLVLGGLGAFWRRKSAWA